MFSGTGFKSMTTETRANDFYVHIDQSCNITRCLHHQDRAAVCRHLVIMNWHHLYNHFLKSILMVGHRFVNCMRMYIYGNIFHFLL